MKPSAIFGSMVNFVVRRDVIGHIYVTAVQRSSRQYDGCIEPPLEYRNEDIVLTIAYKHMLPARNLEDVRTNACFFVCGAYHGYGPVLMPGEWH